MTLMKQCAECRWPAEIGSRCGDHWVTRHAKQHNLCNVKWFLEKRETFIHLLIARYTAIVEGAPDPDTSCFERLFAEARVPSSLQKIRTIVNAADRAARKERHERESAAGSAGRGRRTEDRR
jgi:hypothetical protein